MNTQIQTTRNNALCDICQQKPKFGAYNYCGKNCAAQAAALCDFCHQKPKFNGHDYCSKKCGSQAKSQVRTTSPKANGGRGRGVGGKKGSTGFAIPLPQPAQVLNAVGQILPHLPQQVPYSLPIQAAQILPHLQAMVQQQGQQNPQPYPMQPQPIMMPSKAPLPQIPATPLANTTNLTTVPGTYQIPVQAMPGSMPVINCQVPGCQQPAHVDPASGQAGNYCSMQHREEAVKLGLVDACIMCLKMPQNGSDHFCSKACRDEALSKPF